MTQHRGARAALSLVLGAFLVLIRPAPAPAVEQDVFTVSGVRVDVTADSAAAARDRALIEGQRRALEALLRRLTLPEDHGRLPAPGDAQVGDMVFSFGVDDERTSPVRYIASLTVTFRPEDVRGLLNAAGLPFAEPSDRPVVVLPVFQTADGPVLWEYPNAWRSAWAQRNPSQDLLPLVVPLGELPDVVAVDAEQALAGDPEAVAAIEERYGADGVLIAQALVEEGERPVVVAAADYLGGLIEVGRISHRVEAEGGEDVDAVAARAVEAVAADVQDAWKRRHALRFDQEGRMVVSIGFDSLEDWVAIRQRLENVAAVRNYEVRSLGRNKADVELAYAGGVEQLTTALERANLSLAQEEASAPADWPTLGAGAGGVASPINDLRSDGTWTLRLREGGARGTDRPDPMRW